MGVTGDLGIWQPGFFFLSPPLLLCLGSLQEGLRDRREEKLQVWD